MPKVSDERVPGSGGKVNKPGHFLGVFQTFGVVFPVVNGNCNIRAEACPWCGKAKFYVNMETGQYDCKHCGQKGNVTTFLTWIHRQCLEQTTADHYSQLGRKRGIAPQTLRRHQLAYDREQDRWLMPFTSSNGNVLNMQLYYWNRNKPNKSNLPGLPTSIYNFPQLVKAGDKPVLLCEGPFDAIALDYSIGPHNRSKYAIIAVPGSGFKQEWVPHFKGLKVRALYHNDNGGRQQSGRVKELLGESRVAELQFLEWPAGYPDGCDLNDLIRRAEFKANSILGWVTDHCRPVTIDSPVVIYHGRRPPEEDTPTDEIWPNHIPCETYAAFSGRMGTLKSTIAFGEIAARHTTGRTMPLCDALGLPAGHVLCLSAEGGRKEAENHFEWGGGDFSKWHYLPATTTDGDSLNVLDHLEGIIRETVYQFGIRLIILDGQNSVVGKPNICTDMLARHNVTNKLHHFAQKMKLCLLGLRNEDNEGRALGPQSMRDIGRCVMRTVEDKLTNPRHLTLEFVKVNDCAPETHPPIPFAVANLGGAHRKILWEKGRPGRSVEAMTRIARNGQGHSH
jgi:hypothetical protein